MTLAEVRAMYEPGALCAASDSLSPDGARMGGLLDSCEKVLGSLPLSYGVGHCRLYIQTDPPGRSNLRVEVFFEAQFVEVSWLEQWDEAESLWWLRRESLRGPAEQAAGILHRFLCRLGCSLQNHR